MNATEEKEPKEPPKPSHPTQKKKLETDPDWDQLNPEIIKLAHNNGFINQPIQLFLHGELTWLECLETIVLLVTKEYRAQNRLLIDTLSEMPHATLLLNGANGELVKALPPRPLTKKCDGDHGDPPCADPECWLREVFVNETPDA